MLIQIVPCMVWNNVALSPPPHQKPPAVRASGLHGMERQALRLPVLQHLTGGLALASGDR